VHPALKLVRAGNMLVSFFGTIVGGLDAAGVPAIREGSFWLVALLAATSTACITAGGNVLNDVLDVTSDRVNHPDRPLVTGAVTVPAARRAAIGLFVAGVASGVPVSLLEPSAGVILAVAVLALLGYELRFKASGFGGNLLVAFLTGAVFLYGGAAAGNLPVVIPFALMAFGATLSREVIKDMEDVAGDVNRRTLPRKYGMRTARVVATLSVLGSLAISPIPLFLFVPFPTVGAFIYLALVLAADGLFVLSIAWLPQRLHFEQATSKAAMTIALVAFLAAVLR
jgi:geranylgeranylglycerol-phosphate geranylgeranyltransferase